MSADRVEGGPAEARTDAAFDRALAAHMESRLADAEQLYAAVLAREPGHAGALCYLGLLRLQQDRAADAATMLREAIACDPESAEAHQHLGTALQRLGRHADALEQHARALGLAPGYADALHGRGTALLALGRAADAVASLEDAIAAEPESAAIRLALAGALQEAERWDEAFVHYRYAAALDPANGAPLGNALGAFARQRPEVAQHGMARLNRYVAAFLTNHANPRMGVYPGLTSAPFHDPARLAGARALEQNYSAIRAEIEGLAAGAFQAESEGLMERGAWDVLLLYERGRKNAENCKRCPVITRIIEGHATVRTHAGLLYVSKLSPGTEIKPHRGPTNLRLRCHLGITIPHGDCGLRVGGETRRWQEGRCLLFDDSLEHEAWNRTATPRIVLIIDFWHPDLTPAEIAFLEGLHRYAAFHAVSLGRYWAANAEARAKARLHYD
jgi:aspartate beta-hydroxylase